MSDNEQKIPMWPSDFCVNENEIWFMHGKINLLMKYDMESQLTSFIGVVPGEELFEQNLYRSIYKYKNKLIMVPCWAREIAIYYIDEERFDKIKLDNIDKNEGKLLFCKAFAFGRYLYCIPYLYRAIVKIDMESMTLEYEKSWVEPTLEEVQIKDFYFNDAAQITDTELAIVCFNTNRLFRYDMSTDKMQITKIAEADDNYTSVACSLESIFLNNEKDNTIMVCSIEHPAVVKKLALQKFEGAVVLSTGTEKIIYDSLYDENVIFIDSAGKTEEKTDAMALLRNEDTLNYSYHYGICKKDVAHAKSFYYFNRNNNMMYYFNNNKIMRNFEFNISDQEIKKIKQLMSDFYQGKMIVEDRIFMLEYWLKSIKVSNEQIEENRITSHSFGSMIHSNIKDLLKI